MALKIKMTRKELAVAIAKQTNLNLEEAEQLIVAFGEVVSETLEKNEKITYSNFGTFYTVHYPSKVIFHPKYGEAKKMVMLPTDVVKWMPSGNIKELVKSGIITENPTMHGAKKQARIPELKINKFNNIYQNTEPPKESSVPAQVNNEIAAPSPKPVTTPTLQPKLQDKILEKEKLAEDEISIPIRTQNKKAETGQEINNSPVNIYEELLTDGSKVESTFGDAIRIHKDKTKSFFGKIFGAKEEEIDDKTQQSPSNHDLTTSDNQSATPISLAGSGIFDNVQPKPKQADPADAAIPPTPAENKSQEEVKPVKEIKTDTNNSPDQRKNSFEFFGPEPNSNVNLNTIEAEKEIEIKPFGTKESNVSYRDLSKTIVPKEILQKIPEKMARKYKTVPIEERDGKLVVAMIDPEDIEAKEIIKKQVQSEIVANLVSEADINHILDQYSGFEGELKEALETISKSKPESKEEELDKIALIESASSNAPAARIVTSLLNRAIREKASDIHIEPSEKEVDVRYRVDGVLKKKASLPKDIQLAVISRIKILSNMKIDEQRLPQDGRFSIPFEERKIDFRVSSMPVANGEKVVMRVLDKSSGILSIEELGIRGSGLETLKEAIGKSHGMTLVTGPTGSGKTTTLYALIDKLYTEGVNIVTLEDPIEYRMPGINQSQVNPEIEYTFASGLRSLVRQDPDIIMLGEIRDSETAEMAVHAALTGHIVLSTLHTNDAAGTAPRLIDMNVEPFLLTSSLNSIVAQRLARKICDDCKEEIKIEDEELVKIKQEIAKMPEAEKQKASGSDLKFYHGKGCKNCGDTGYKSRIGLFEILGITETIKELILKKESSNIINETAIKEGMVTMLQDGILKCLDGLTTIEEVWRTTKE